MVAVDTKVMIDIVTKAACVIMQYYSSGVSVYTKQDGSTVTTADHASNDILTQFLREYTPDIPIISEENDEQSNLAALKSDKFWLIDPLDGTKGFVSHNDQFAISVALIEHNVPIWGMLYVPIDKVIFYEDNGRILKSHISGKVDVVTGRDVPDSGVVIFARPDSFRAFEHHPIIKKYKVADKIFISSAIKFGRMLNGEVDIYINSRDIMDWDIAAGDAMLRKVGGAILGIDGSPLRYGINNTFRKKDFIALARV
jgi:3'(2'), 5'-bisphosphate nucleotidase